MAIDKDQLRIEVIRPVLMTINLYNDNAEELLMGTAAQESHLGTYIRQIKGEAYGIYQCERLTYDSLWNKYIGNSRAMQLKILPLLGTMTKPAHYRLVTDMNLATIMCRLHYWDVQETLPNKDNVEAMGSYWKTYYNTVLGKGTVDEFIGNYKKYVGKGSA
jgi:hypothetical protein